MSPRSFPVSIWESISTTTAGCAVASSLAAVQAGARQIQGCVNGYGERTGNADLCSIIPDLVLKMGIPVVSPELLAELAPTSHHIAEIVNITLDPHRPYVGTSAFTHKAGLHTSALARRPDAYEHTPPYQVGNTTRMVVSEQAGRASVLSKAAEFGLELTDAQARAGPRTGEGAGACGLSIRGGRRLLRVAGEARPLGWIAALLRDRVVPDIRRAAAREEVVAEATVKVMVEATRGVSTGDGNGPVNALDQALRAALRRVPRGGPAPSHRLPGPSARLLGRDRRQSEGPDRDL